MPIFLFHKGLLPNITQKKNLFYVPIKVRQCNITSCTKNGTYTINVPTGVAEWHALGYTRDLNEMSAKF